MKKGFTLIEMLVVIGIIGVLTAVLLGTFTGSTESARAVRCLANMHNIANANSTLGNGASAGSTIGEMPFMGEYLAGSDEMPLMDNARGWIDWYHGGALPREKSDGSGTPEFNVYPSDNPQSPTWFKSTYETDEDIRNSCLTNGTLWAPLGRNRSVYVCPEHITAVRSASYGGNAIASPVWSYIMNGTFDVSLGTICKASGGVSMKKQKGAGLAGTTILLCELPFIEVKQINQKPNFSAATGPENDPTLEWPGCPECSASECIAFNHKIGKQLVAHLCFMDGHVEKFRLTKKMNRTELEAVTRWLANGLEFDFDGASGKYRLMEGIVDTTK